jgi:tetratricopeptide (TPR) repeat protein
VTHIALTSAVDFLAPYHLLLHPNATQAEIQRSFGYELLYGQHVPAWLQEIPYRAPDDLASLNVRVRLFKVAFGQTEDEALYHVATAKVARGEFAEAARDFDVLIQRVPAMHRAWLGKAGALLSMRAWADATDAALGGISRAPAGERVALTEWVAGNLLRENQGALALRVYRDALAREFNADMACGLAFLLATSSDAQLRSGAEAVRHAQRAVESQPDSPTYMLCLGAALAEAGRFADAARATERAGQRGRELGDGAVVQAAEQMGAAFRSGRAWRR